MPDTCEAWKRGAAQVPAATTTAPTTSGGSGGGLGAWVSDHAGMIVLVVAGLIALAVWRSVVSGNAEESAAREAGALARGRRIAEDWYAGEVAKAQAEAVAMVPDRSVYDPAGVGLAPPPPPQARYVPRPPMTNTDLKRYAAFDSYAPWIEGTAFAAVTMPDGGWNHTATAWNRACEAAGAGHTEDGAFTPIATLTRVFNTKGGRRAIIAVEPRDVTIGEQELNRARELFARLARVRTVHPFTRDHSTGRFEAVLSNDDDQQPTQAPPAPAQPTAEQVDADDPWS